MKLNIQKQHCTAFKRYGEKRDGVFDSIEIHSIGCAQNTAKNIRDNMNKYSPDGIVHAVVDAETEGLVLELLPDTNIVWADGGYGNHHSFTIEIAESDYMKYTGGANFTVTNQSKFLADINRGYNTAVEYVAKKCKEFNFDPMKKLSNGLFTVYSHQEANKKGLATAHVDPSHIFVKIGKSMDTFRADVKKAMGIKEPIMNEPTPASGMPTSKQDYIDKVAAIAVELYPKTKILPSVVIGQTCLENGYGLAEDCRVLTENNNLLGMKVDLINNTWKDYTVWDGEYLTKKTPEYYSGKLTYINDQFRVYKDYKNCIEDYEMFLTHVKNNNGYKYRRIVGVTNPAKFLEYLYNNGQGYCTDMNYQTKVLKIISENNLEKYDKLAGVGATTKEPEVQKTITQYKVQIGAYSKMENANACAKKLKEKGFKPVFVASGTNVCVLLQKTFAKKAKAEKRAEEARQAGFTAIVKEV